MNNYQPETETQSVLNDPYEKETLLHLWQYERKKTAQSLFIIAAILLFGNGVAYASANALDITSLPDILLFPLLIFGLGVFAYWQPLISVIGAVAIVVVITVLGVLAAGAVSLISGWLFKVFALYFIITAVRHAREAEKARKQLQLLG